MKVKTQTIRLKTKGFGDTQDITGMAQNLLQKSGILEGQATLFVVGSTGALTTIEFEPGVVQDLKELFEGLAPEDKDYHHEQAWHDGNGFSHVRASLLKPSLTIPFVDAKFTLGTWQQIVLIDFDNRSRNREVVLQMMGE